MFLFSSHGSIPRWRFPRVCGDVPDTWFRRWRGWRFSPRMRGCSPPVVHRPGTDRVFPAYAGMFLPAQTSFWGALGFPRVCGDVPVCRHIESRVKQFSPRMRGCSANALARAVTTAVFPAYAGMFRSRPPHRPKGSGFPRVCGDVPTAYDYKDAGQTFSPRMRGCSDIGQHTPYPYNVFPAYAGMFRRCGVRWPHDRSFPRVCGDVPVDLVGFGLNLLFSPRMRGCSAFLSPGIACELVFPAYAGMFLLSVLFNFR